MTTLTLPSGENGVVRLETGTRYAKAVVRVKASMFTIRHINILGTYIQCYPS